MKKLYRTAYLWVLLGIFLGGALGWTFPHFASSLKPLGDGFVSLIKMMIGPIIFCTVVLGISGAGDVKHVGRVGAKALVYFEVLSTFALAVGLLVGNLLKPGHGFNVDVATLDASLTSDFAKKAGDLTIVQHLLGMIPKTFFDALTGGGDLIQILFIALLFGFSLNRMGENGKVVHHFIEAASQIFLGMLGTLMLLAPIGAFGAMAFTIGTYGLKSLQPMMFLMGSFYLTCLIFVFGVLGLVAKLTGFSLWRFVVFIKDELLTVLATSSSETALVPLMKKLEKLGCAPSVVGLVVPAGYSFNLDGTNIYLTLAVLFLAQALNIDLTVSQQLAILLVAMLTSKGASGVTGAGFITLAATLAVVPRIPIASLALILGIDRFMSEARALTNLIGNGVATIVVSRWEKRLDFKTLNENLHG